MKLATKAVLAFTMMMMLVGCFSSLYPPPRKAMLQVESPPHRTTMIIDADDMTLEMVQMCMKINNHVKYKNYKFNENFIFSAVASGTQDMSRNTSSTTTLSKDRAVTVTDNRPPDEKGL